MFISIMLVNGATNPFLCWTFPTFPEKMALLWFFSLPTRSIHDFAKFSRAFVNRFFSSWVYKKTSDSLSAIRQGPQEPLREYLDRFNVVAMKIQDLDPTVDYIPSREDCELVHLMILWWLLSAKDHDWIQRERERERSDTLTRRRSGRWGKQKLR